MYTFEYPGEPLTFQRSAAASDAVATINSSVYQISNRKIGYTSGGTYTILAGDMIVGATSSAVAIVTEVVLASGTWAGGDAAGTLYIHNQIGTFNSSAETLKVIKTSDGSAVADGATSVAGDSRQADKDVVTVRTAKAVLVQVKTNPINYTVGTEAPTTDANTTLAAHGIQLVAGTNKWLSNPTEFKNFKWINATASSNAEVRFQGYF